MTPYISLHFTLPELTTTHYTVDPQGNPVDNQPVDECLASLRQLANTILEGIRLLWVCPVLVTSAYRGPAVERHIQEENGLIQPGGVVLPSQHLVGQAADILPCGPTAPDIVTGYEMVMKSDLPYDQLLFERSGPVQWIHVSCSPLSRAPRKQALYSPDNGRSWAYYKVGIVGGQKQGLT
jgi:hypothetical protein